MNIPEKEEVFLEDLKQIMIKHGVTSIRICEQGAIYCTSDYFSAEEALIHFEN